MNVHPRTDAQLRARRTPRRIAMATAALAFFLPMTPLTATQAHADQPADSAVITAPMSGSTTDVGTQPAANATADPSQPSAAATDAAQPTTTTASPTMTGSIGMEDGLRYGNPTADGDAVATNLTGTPFLVPADGMSLFRSMALTGNALDITIRFRSAFADGQQYVSLLEIADSTNVYPGTGRLDPARSTLGLVAQRDGTIWLQTGSYAGGTDWTKNTGVRIDDGAFHTLTVRLAASGMTVAMDGRNPATATSSGNRGTSAFVAAFFGSATNGSTYRDWRQSIDTIAIGGMTANAPIAHTAWPNLTGQVAGITITSANTTAPAGQTTAFQAAMTDNSVKDATWLFVGGREVEGLPDDIGSARDYVGMFEEYSRWTKAANTFGMQRYTINAGVDGQDLAAVNARIDDLIARTKPKAIVFAIGSEDYSHGTAQLQTFRTSLEELATKALALRDGQGTFVIQLPHAVPDATQQANAKAYAAAARAVIEALPAEAQGRTLIVDHMASTEHDVSFLADGVSLNGILTAAGHEAIGRQLSEAVFGDAAGYQTREGTWVPGTRENTYEPQDDYRTVSAAIRAKVDDASTPLTWVFMGDSITHGAAHLHGYDSVSQLFEHYLKSDLARTDDLVINTAVSGAMTDGGGADQPWRSTVKNVRERMAVYRPDVVVIQLGTNDGDATADSYETHLKQVVADIRQTNPQALIVLRSPTPAKDAPYSTRLVGDTGSVARMRKVADETGALFIDQYTDWQAELEADPTGWNADRDFGDGKLHPSAHGHLRMFRQLVGEIGLDTSTPLAMLDYNVPNAPEPTPNPEPGTNPTPTPDPDGTDSPVGAIDGRSNDRSTKTPAQAGRTPTTASSPAKVTKQSSLANTGPTTLPLVAVLAVGVIASLGLMTVRRRR